MLNLKGINSDTEKVFGQVFLKALYLGPYYF